MGSFLVKILTLVILKSQKSRKIEGTYTLLCYLDLKTDFHEFFSPFETFRVPAKIFWDTRYIDLPVFTFYSRG